MILENQQPDVDNKINLTDEIDTLKRLSGVFAYQFMAKLTM